MSYNDSRLAAIYDIDNLWDVDDEYFRSLANSLGAKKVVDLGCGTGRLTVTLANPGREVIGIDPAPEMLDRAKSRPGGDKVLWRCGDAGFIESESCDLVIMSSNVAMHILGSDWRKSLNHISQGLRPGGILAFEARNPEAQAWLHWTEGPTERETPVGALRERTITDPPDTNGVVVMHCQNEFLSDNYRINVDLRLQFRSYQQIISDLTVAGLRVISTHRDWQGQTFTGGCDQPLMIFTAIRE